MAKSRRPRSKHKTRNTRRSKRKKAGRAARKPTLPAVRARSRRENAPNTAPYWKAPYLAFLKANEDESTVLSTPERQTLSVLCQALPDGPPPWCTASWSNFLSTEFYLLVDEPLESADALDLVDEFFDWCMVHAYLPADALGDLLEAVDEHRVACASFRLREPKGAFMEERELAFLVPRFMEEANLGPFLDAHPALVESGVRIGWNSLLRAGRPGRWDGFDGDEFLEVTLRTDPMERGVVERATIDLIEIVAAFIRWMPESYLVRDERSRLLEPLARGLLSLPRAA